MNGLYTFARPGAPRAAFGAILRNEARLVWRQPAGAIAAIGVSTLILVIFGELNSFQQPSSRLDGLSAFQIYIPILEHRARAPSCLVAGHRNSWEENQNEMKISST